MAVTQNSYTGNGSTTNYSFTFPYLATTDIKVKLDGVDTTAYSFANATTVQMNSAPANGAKIIIYRNTNNDNTKATFYAGSALKSEDLNDNFTQILYVAQEVDNNALTTLGDTAMQGDFLMGPGFGLQFEGSTDDDNETRLVAADPTADRTITLPNVTGNVITTGDTGTVTDAMLSGGTALTSAEKTKLTGIETGATGDQTNAEIRAAVEAASDSNVFTDADHSKLNAIEASATADQTAAEIRTLVGSASDSNVFTDADHTKLDGIATSANNYTHPNHSGEVTSTADGATVIADNVVDEANLKISNAGSDGQYLQKQSGNTGGLTWATVSGGGSSVGGATGVDFNDDVKVRFGTGNDLELYFNGTNSYIVDNGAGDLWIKNTSGDDIFLQSVDDIHIRPQNGEDGIKVIGDGGVDIFYDGDRKLKTIATGAEVENSSGDAQLVVHSEHDDSGSDAIFKAYTENNQANCYLMFGDSDDTFVGGFKYQNTDNKLIVYTNNAASWHWDSSGNLTSNSDTNKLQLGASEDLSIYHDGSHSYIDDTGTGNLYIKSSGLWLRDSGNGGIQNLDGTENHIQWHVDGATEIYYDSVLRLATASTGATCTGSGFLTFEIESSDNDAVLSLKAAGDDATDWSIRNDLSETNDLDFRYNNNRRLNLDKDGTLSVTKDINIGGSIDEHVYNCTGTALDPNNGTVQYKTLGANTTLTESLTAGQSMLLMVDDGSSYTVTWPTMTWVGGSAPTLATSGYSCIELWKIASTLYGCHIGDVA